MFCAGRVYDPPVRLAPLVAIAFVLGCRSQPVPNPPTDVRDYFPDEHAGGFVDFVRVWYGGVLQPMDEPSLWLASSATPSRESWRFMWLRTWGHPVAIRFDVDGSGATMRYVELDGKAGYQPGKMVIDRARHVTSAEWAGVAAAIAKTGFWSLPTRSTDSGFDGLEWVIEGTAGGRYHVTDRWTPSEDAAGRGLVDYQAACKAAFDLAGVAGTFE